MDQFAKLREICPAIRENKPSWADLPARLVESLEDLLHSRISEATPVWGGYGPSATFAIRTENGRGYFCKGTHPGHTEEGGSAIRRERAVYEAFPELQRFAPRYHGFAQEGAWQFLILDAIESRQRVPPWTDGAFRQVTEMLARFHRSMPATARSTFKALDVIFAPNLCAIHSGWKSLSENPSRRTAFLSLFADPSAAGRWLGRHIESFVQLESMAAQLGGPFSWIHQDIRSDNILFKEDTEILLADWPYLGYGPILIDVAFFLPSVWGEGGPSAMGGLREYERQSGLYFSERDIQIAVATVAGFFAARAGEPEIPGLPRLRWVQRLQLFPSLEWLSQVAGVEPPAKPVCDGRC